MEPNSSSLRHTATIQAQISASLEDEAISSAHMNWQDAATFKESEPCSFPPDNLFHPFQHRFHGLGYLHLRHRGADIL